MTGTSKLAVVAFVVAAAVAFAGTAVVGADSAVAKKKVSLKIRSDGQKRILRKHSIEVKVKALKEGKTTVKVKAHSTTFDQQEQRKLAQPKKVRLAHRKATKKIKLRLTKKGRQAIASCQGRKLLIDAKHAGQVRAELTRNTSTCKPKPIDLSRADSCDFIGAQQGSLCLMPFPDDYYTVKDSASATGRRVNLTDAGMPQNASGTPIAAAPYNANDGFSPGQVITLKVPGLDTPAAFTNTDPIPLNDLSRNESQDSNEPIVVIDTETNQRVPIWVELDSNATSPATTALLIHPATQFESGHRYVVAMHRIKDAAGNKLAAPEGFRYYRDDLPSSEAKINDQRKRFDKAFRTLRKAHVKRHNLYLAWDFTVASDDNIAQRMLHIRDDAFAQLGDTNLSDGVVQGSAPAFTVDEANVVNNPSGAPRSRGGSRARSRSRAI